MYKLKILENTPRNNYNLGGIPEIFSMEKLSDLIGIDAYNNARYRSEPYCVCLKAESEFIPIINVFSSSLSKKNDIGSEDNLRIKLKSSIRPLLSPYYKEDLEELIIEFDAPITSVYNKIINTVDGAYTLNTPIRGGRNNSTTMRVKELQNILDSNATGRIFTSYKGDSNMLVYPFYFVSNDSIIFSMMVKKECIPQFRRNWYKSEVDPAHVEIWVNKAYIENNDKTSFNKWIREVFLMKLVMQGFTIKVKDDINSEIIRVPKLELPNTIEGIINLKKTITKMMV